MEFENFNCAIQSIVRKDIQAMTPYSVPDLPENTLKLDAMESPWGVPKHLQSDLDKVLSNVCFNRYPEPSPKALKQSVFQLECALYNHIINENQLDVIFGNGSDELIQMIIMACSKAGSGKVMSISPSFVMYKVVAEWLERDYVDFDLNEDFSLSQDLFIEALKKEKPDVLFLAIPNNPTATLLSNEFLEHCAQSFDGVLVLDCAYGPFCSQDLNHLLALPNVIMIKTLSKIGFAGLRLGYCLGAVSWLSQLNKVRMPYNVNVYTQAIVQFAVSHLSDFKHNVQLLLTYREELKSQLLLLSQEYRVFKVLPTHANFYLLQFESELISQRFFDFLLERGVLVKNLSKAHHLLRGILRITIGADDENKIVIDHLKVFCSTL